MQVSSLGRYKVRGEIGRGNMGVVYRGYDPVIDRMVALKTVNLPQALPKQTRDSFLDRFMQEARIAGRLLHPNIVVTYDAARDEKTGIPFMVMELVEGEPLSERLKRRGALPWRDVLELIIPLARALEYAHENGVVHRDIKPANVILTPEGVPKIADFGIAKLPATDQTHTETIVGTPHFMSPEQLMGKRLDGRSDIFSLGVLLYFSITGRRPFDGPDVPTIVSQVLYKDPKPIVEMGFEGPQPLGDVIARALEKDVDRRYGTGTDLVEDLLAVERGEAPASTVPVGDITTVQDIVPPEPSVQPPLSDVRAERPRKRFRLLRVGLALTAIVVVPLLIFLLGREISGPHLPLELTATHHHFVGGCSGKLALHEWGIEYESQEHGTWRWEWVQIHKMEREDARSFSVETREDELLGLVGNKRYNFTLSAPGLEDDFWEDYRAVAAAAEPPPVKSKPRESRSLPEESNEPPQEETTEADLFYAATVAFENEDLEESQKSLEELLQKNPDFAGAAQLLKDVDVQLWKETLPLSFTAKHNHRIGDCTGKLTLDDWGIEYRSSEHGLWRWSFHEIRIMERPSQWRLEIETEEVDILAMGQSKKYKFELRDEPLDDQVWRRYQRLAEKAEPK